MTGGTAAARGRGLLPLLLQQRGKQGKRIGGGAGIIDDNLAAGGLLIRGEDGVDAGGGFLLGKPVPGHQAL